MKAPQTLWFTGLSGAGKSTLSKEMLKICEQQNFRAIILDGDALRAGLCANLGFSDQDRHENIRRIIEVSKLFLAQGFIVIVAAISPFAQLRQQARDALSAFGPFSEIYCSASLNTCETRDVKGLYKEARDGQHQHFTGIGSQYEAPLCPEVIIDSSSMSITESVAKIVQTINAYQHDQSLLIQFPTPKTHHVA